MSDTSTDDRYTLSELSLRPGMLLDVRPELGSTGTTVQFCAAIKGKGIMVVPVASGTLPSRGDRHVLSGFTGTHEFWFRTEVLQLFAVPFRYAMLAYPETVSGRCARTTQRMAAEIPGISCGEDGKAQTVVLVDLSASGAMLSSIKPVGRPGDAVTVAFAIDVNGTMVDLVLEASVCHSASIGDAFRTGVAFRNCSRNDRLALNYFAASGCALAAAV